MADHFGTISMKWDPKNLEIRTMSVEKTLEPLVLQVSVPLRIISVRVSSQFYPHSTCLGYDIGKHQRSV